MTRRVRIKEIEPITRNVHNFVVEKPKGFDFEPGQATDLSIDADGWLEEQRPFTFTSLPHWDDLHFTIKHYSTHQGVTDRLSRCLVRDYFLIGDPWGAIRYKGKGTFIAGGAGITPFLSILRGLKEKSSLTGHRLIFANRKEADIIMRNELEKMPGLEIMHVLSDETQKTEFHSGYVDEDLLRETINDFDQNFYVSGPMPMQDSVTAALEKLGASAESLVIED